MGAYEYVALDPGGRKKKGVLEGDTPRQARQRLREQGLTPLSIDAVIKKEKGRRRSLLARGISSNDLAMLTRQLATLSQSGLPLEHALKTVADQAEGSRVSSTMMAVRSRVMEGHPLVTGLADFPHVFSDLYRATASAGEQSGHLDVVLERLADYTEARQQMRQKIQMALLYPIILTVMAIAVTVGLLTYVVPKVVQVFEDTGQALPDLTVALISTSEFLQHHGLEVLLALTLVFFAGRYLLRLPKVKLAWHRLLLRLPVIGKLVRAVNTGRFLRTLSILMASGVPILDALRISSEVLANLPMRAAVEEAAQRVREGATLNASLQKHRLFPPMAVQLIASGEAGGNLDDMLQRAAVNQEREVESTIATVLGLFEPLMILVMALIVLIIVLAILLPIFDLNQLVK